MGYTHYWEQLNGAIPAAAWTLIQADAKKLIAASPVKLAFDYDEPTKKPVCDASEIRFNGVGDEGNETFMLMPEPADFEFCKTAHKPYDLVVCAILACAKEHAADFIDVSSDGEAEEWAEELAWADSVLGRTLALPFKDWE